MYKNIHNDKWNINLTMTDTLDLVYRIFYKLDKNLFIYSKLNDLQKILIDDYQLITMNQFKNKNNFEIQNNKIIPIPKDDGDYVVYFEIKNLLPNNKNILVINNDMLNKFLLKENKCISKKGNYDVVLLNVKINDNNCTDEIHYLPTLIKEFVKALNNLTKGGDLYINLNYYYHKPNIQLLQYILSLFDGVDHIENKLTKNKIGNDMLKFINYNGYSPKELINIIDEYDKNHNNEMLNIVNNYYCNMDVVNGNVIKNLFDNNIDDNFITFLNGIYKQQNIYIKQLIKKTKFINYNKIFNHINNQIDVATSWCENNNVEMNEVYKENKIITKLNIIKKYFRDEKGVNMSQIKMTNDSLYSVSLPNVANEMSKIIRDAIPNIKIIVDGTANIGGNTLNFSSYFDHVISVEIDPKTFNILKNNVNVYKRSNVELINDDFVNLIDNIYGDVVFMDPPWTGTFYKMQTNMDLYLSGVNIIDIIPRLKCRMVALKLPINYNIVGLLNKNMNISIFKIYGVILILIKK